MLANLPSYVYVGKLAANEYRRSRNQITADGFACTKCAIRQISRANGVSKRHWSSTLRPQQQVIGFESVPIYTSGLAVDVVWA